ncbi:prefoldin subunit alpha [Candidatus Micrarchaeota archaeon]|nr:prefoldin subunit alpha [Candidatus Micrarchaeota archaeon]
MANEEELNKLSYEAQYLQTQMQEMQRQLSQAVAVGIQLDSTQKSISGLPDVTDETYFQLGAGTFIKAKPANGKSVIIDVGAGVFLEKPFGEAIELLKKRKSNVDKAIETLRSNIEKISKRLSEIDLEAAKYQ